MAEPITYVGIDAHTRELEVAMLVGNAERPTTWRVSHEPRGLERLRRKLEREAPAAIVCCYEAGPCGYALQRQLTSDRIRCDVIAPGLTPRKPGDRIKTDRRDARKLAELHRASMLTVVQAPSEAAEAVRDLCRARDDARTDVMRCRHRLHKFLLRHGLRYPGRNWTRTHRAWIAQVTWEYPATRYVVQDYWLAITQLEARLAEFDRELEALAHSPQYREAVGWLRCFRGVDTVSAMMLLSELYDFRRFPNPRALMAFVGLVPGEHSSGDRTRRGRITKMGNGIVRRVLIEAAWHYQHGARVGRPMRLRRVGQPAAIIAIADKAQMRLCRRFHRLRARQKPTPMIAVAIARELVGFMWAALQPRAITEA